MAKKAGVKMLLTEQFAVAHYEKNWFASLRSAVDGLTVEEALWKPGKTERCVWELVAHLHYWNNRFLLFFKGVDPGKWIGDNDDTFRITSGHTLKGLRSDLKKLEAVTKEFDRRIRTCKPAKLDAPLSKTFQSPWYSVLVNLSAHTAYHTGQIVMLRKMHKTWNAKKNGV